MVRRTRKGKVGKVEKKKTPISNIRKAFEHIEQYVLKKNPSITDLQKEWKKTFLLPLREKAAKDYLEFMQTTKAQRGGAQQTMSPASLAYDLTSPQTAGAVHVPPYVSGGFGRVNMASIPSQCGLDTTPHPADHSKVNNMVGGKRKTKRRKQKGGGYLGTAFGEFSSRPFGISSPLTPLQDFGALRIANNTLASPRPEINPLTGITTRPMTIYNASINPVSAMF